MAHFIFIQVVLRLFFDGLLGEVLHVGDVGKCNCIVICSNMSLYISNCCQSVEPNYLHSLLGKGGIIQKSDCKSH